MSKKIKFSGKKIYYHEIPNAPDSGFVLADVLDVAMDKEFLERSRHDWCWVGSKNIPAETGWFKVDRENSQIIKINEADASELEWHERLYIYESALSTARQNSPLALYIGDEYSDGRLSALYLCGPDVLAWVAEKEV